MSIFNRIANYLISQKESPKTIPQFVSWQQLTNVILIAHDHQLSNCVDFVNACKADKIHVRVAVIFEGKPEHAPKPSFDHTILDKKQFSFFGLPKENVLRNLNSETVDVLINLGNERDAKSYSLSKLISSKCKIGTFQDSIFQMSIYSDDTMNSNEYLKQVIVYLKMIKPLTK